MAANTIAEVENPFYPYSFTDQAVLSEDGKVEYLVQSLEEGEMVCAALSAFFRMFKVVHTDWEQIKALCYFFNPILATKLYGAQH